MPDEVRLIIDAMGHRARTEILRHLAGQSLGVRELADVTGTVVSQVRKHLAILEDVGLVIADASAGERRPGGRGRAVSWRTAVTRVEEIGQIWISYASGRDTPPSFRET